MTTNKSWTLIEPCAGSFAFTLHMLGAKQALLPYQGSKWKYRAWLQYVAKWLGYDGVPTQVILTDPGPWGVVSGAVLNYKNDVIEALKEFQDQDPKTVYDSLIRQKIELEYEVDVAAQFLFLQRVSFSGKSVGFRKLGDELFWSVPGFNPTSAYGKEKTDKFGAIKPMIPALLKVLESYNLSSTVVSSGVQTASVHEFISQPTLVYIDPPYKGQTGYPNGTLSREEVIDLALGWKKIGASVMVSEAEPIEELVSLGWETQKLRAERKTKNPFQTKKNEFVTYIK